MNDIQKALEQWWRVKTDAEVEAVIPKVQEYGSKDLAVIGETMARMAGWDTEGMDHAQFTEVGIFFYLVGKIARWEDAIANRRPVSNDTLHDIAVYTKMAQRVKDVGGWPFDPNENGIHASIVLGGAIIPTGPGHV